MTQAADLVNALAPEHLELAVEDLNPGGRYQTCSAIFLAILPSGRLHCRAQSRAADRARVALCVGIAGTDFMKRSRWHVVTPLRWPKSVPMPFVWPMKRDCTRMAAPFPSG